jgi:methionyl-tRNA synthetase
MPKFYLTTPLYYANARPHVGSAYTTLVCDTLARYRRMCGDDVAFLTGTDEHGENIERAAARQGISPAELVDRNCQMFRALWQQLGIAYTHFVRTTEARHVHTVQTMLRRARQRGYVYKGVYRGRYCIHDNLYVSDSEEPSDCPTCGRPAELMSEENYFFRLSAFQQPLLEHYERHPEFIQPAFRRNEVIRFVSDGLKDISISRRSIHWGIPWPDDPEHVFYVWYDALSGYLTGIGFAESNGQGGEFARYWPADVHMIGKEILRFHAVYWPAFLMAAELPLPRTIFAHGWLLFEQQKMSKSKGNVAYCEPIIELLGSDALRYYLLREVVFGQDGNFSHEALVTRYNSDLANDLGNLASRTLTMLARYCAGQVPEPGPAGPAEAELAATAAASLQAYRQAFDQFAFSRGLEAIWQLVTHANQYLVETQPWTLAGDPASQPRLASVLYAAAEALRILAVLLAPVLPRATSRLWQLLGQSGHPEQIRLETLSWGGLRPGTRTGPAEPLFPRVEKSQILERMAAMEDQIRQNTGAPAAPATPTASGPSRITIDDFARVDMRVGEIRAAEPVPGTDRLLRLQVDIGSEVRQVVAGIAGSYRPEELIGRRVVVVVNLEPRRLRGVESNGMIVAATRPDGSPVLCTFTEDVPLGARLK